MPKGGICGSSFLVFFFFLRNLHTVLHSDCINLHSHHLVCIFFDDDHSDPCKVIPHCSSDLHFSNNERC